jgi:SnoaL-like protein
MSTTGHIPDLAEMANRMAIADVLAKHSRGVDRADEAALKDAYWPDAEVAYGAYNGPAHPFCENLPKAIRQYSATQHRVTNISIDFKGDDAVVESYVTAYHHRSVPDGDDSQLTYYGRYVDHMQKRGDCWKIMFRRVVMDWNFDDTVAKATPFEGLARGARVPDDPIYEMQKSITGGI